MSENILKFTRTQSFAPPKRPRDPVPLVSRAQSLASIETVKISIDSMYNQAVQYHKKEKNPELAEKAFRAALRLNPNHVQSLMGLGTLLREELDQEEEGTAMLHKATGLILNPTALPGEEKMRTLAAARAGSFKNVFGQEVAAAPVQLESNIGPPVRMGSMKAVLAMSTLAHGGSSRGLSTGVVRKS